MDAELAIIEAFSALHPDAVARVVEESDELDSVALLLELGPERAANVLREMTPTLAARRLERMSTTEAARSIDALSLDSAAALLRRLSEGRRDEIMKALRPGARERSLRGLLAHAPDTAGGLMDPLVLAIPEDISALEALERVRAAPMNAMFYVYVLGSSGKLTGVINQRELMLAPPDAVVSSIMTAPPETLQASASEQAIVAHPAWQRVHALPVIDRRGTFLGAIRYKTARRLEHQLHRSARAPSPDVTARALGEFYGLALTGLGEWILSTARDPSRDGSEGL